MADGGVVREAFQFASSDGASTIHGTIWWPAGIAQDGDEKPSPRGVVQLVHGMAEHISRYDDFACFLCARGFVVAGHDQIGHGDSCDPAKWGCLPMRGGADFLIGDVDKVRAIVSARVAPDTPYVIFGHSLGSFITRCYIARHGAGLAAAIICGTGSLAPSKANAARNLSSFIGFFRGEDHKSKFVDGMGVGAYAKALPDRKTDLDLLSHNEDNVRRYIADPACGFMFSVGGYATVGSLSGEACTPATAEKVPHDLPLLFIAGAEDPVGDKGEGVRAAADLARSAGSTDVTCTIYEGMRHEVLNETGHERVYDDVAKWIDDHIGAGRE